MPDKTCEEKLEELEDSQSELEEEIISDVEKKQPFTYAPITLIVADQGGGKSTILTARAVDDTFSHATSVKLASGYEMPVTPALNEKGKPIVGLVTVHLPNKQPFVAKVPDNACVIAKDIRVFANYHLYGIRSMYTDLATILEYINSDLYLNGWILIDEAYIGANARNSMNLLNQIITQFGMQIRKRRLHLMVSYPLDNMADLIFRKARTEYITPSYNPKTLEVTAEIRKNKEKKKSVTFYAPTYWGYFDTEERFDMPENRIGKAMIDT